MLEYDAFASWACPCHAALITAISARAPQPVVLNIFLSIDFAPLPRVATQAGHMGIPFLAVRSWPTLTWGQVRYLHHRPNLDRPFACARNTSGDVDCLVEVSGFDHEEAAKLFARLRERTVGHNPFALAHPNRGRCRHRLQRRRAQKLAICLERVGKLSRLPVTLLALDVGPGVFVGVNQQHVLHSFPSTSKSNSGCQNRHLKQENFMATSCSMPLTQAPYYVSCGSGYKSNAKASNRHSATKNSTISHVSGRSGCRRLSLSLRLGPDRGHSDRDGWRLRPCRRVCARSVCGRC